MTARTGTGGTGMHRHQNVKRHHPCPQDPKILKNRYLQKNGGGSLFFHSLLDIN
jgi:hypothetical protein